MSLSPKQHAAATRTGQDVCVVAGPGSGKTRVLIHRFAWLVREQRIPASRILAITFTDKAATEIKKRLVREFRDDPATRAGIERAWVSTVHGFCARALKENAIAAGVDPDFGVLDAPTSQAELNEAATLTLDAIFAEDPAGMRSLLNGVHVSTQSGTFAPDLVGALLEVYESLRIAGQDPAALPAMAPPRMSPSEPIAVIRSLLHSNPPAKTATQQQRLELLRDWMDRARALENAPISAAHFTLWKDNICDLHGIRSGDAVGAAVKQAREISSRLRAEFIGSFYFHERNLVIEALRRLDRLYRERKARRSLLDFGDLEEGAIHLLESCPEVRERLRAGFDQILMDEVQDTNPLQWRLMDLLRSPGNFFAVGDINQSIYGFRHADPGLFAGYQQQLEAQGEIVDRLDDNYRSRAEILEVVDLLLGDQPGIVPNPLHAGGRFAEKSVPSVELHAAEADTTEQAMVLESTWVAHRIRELEGSLLVGLPGKQRPARFSDIAVLARTTAALESIREALQQFNVPYLLVGGRTFYEKPEIRDLVHWLELLSNPSDEIALVGVLRSPVVGLSDETLLRLREDNRSLIDSIATAMAGGDPFGINPADLERLEWFWSFFSGQRRLRDYLPPDQLLAGLMDESGYEQTLLPAARRNTEKLLELLRGRLSSSPVPLAELLDELRVTRAAAAEPDAPPDDAANVVTLLTMHGSKGLEFPVVFLPALHKDASKQQPPVSYSPASGLGLNWRDPAEPGQAIGDHARAAYSAEVKAREEDEEQRLLYVAMTRAEEHLVLSYSTSKERSRVASLGRLVATRLASLEVRHRDSAVNGFPPVAESESVVPLLARAIPDGQFDSIVTVTSLATFRECPRRYYLSRYLGIEGLTVIVPGGPSANGGGAARLGTQVHALLADELVEDPDPAAEELAQAFRSSALGQRAARASRREREFDFLMAVEGIVVRGTIDLWFEEGGELLLVDYKTDRPKSGQALGEQYAVQLRLYSLALSQITGRLPDHAALYYARTDEVVTISLSDQDLQDARSAVVELKEAQDRLDFPIRPGDRCRFCLHYHGACPAP